MNAIQKIEILQALMAMFIPNVGPLLIILAIDTNNVDIVDLEEPKWCPPTLVLICLWCVFFCVIGFSSNIVFKSREVIGHWTAIAKAALIIYGIHLVLSSLWLATFIFNKNILLALADLVLVDVTGIHLVYLFYKVKSLAGYLFSMHIIWLVFVTALNCSLLILN